MRPAQSIRWLRTAAAALFAATAALAQPPAELRLPAERTVDLDHVQPANYAAALGKDPLRIFAFVRDHVGHEIYNGALRGPRGTLLAMAGNSIDRAALLASLLHEAGHEARFARGRLPEPRARDLATSLWNPRAARATPRPGTASAEAQAHWQRFETSVRRDYLQIRDQLEKARIPSATVLAAKVEDLMKEAQDHYWVQWRRDGAWLDLDPCFGEAAPGQKFTPTAESLVSLPAELFHVVEMRVRVEEYTADVASSRVLLTHRARAADLSGADIAMTHQPENWAGPATGLADALAAAIGETGRIKPVLLLDGEKWIAGKEAIRQRPPSGAGLGGMADMLRGAGTRNPVPIATAMALEFDFIHPGGRVETLSRVIFDLVGAERRSTNRKLTAGEVNARAAAPDAPRLQDQLFDVLFTTGRIAESHLPAAGRTEAAASGDRADARTALRRIGVAFTILSDSLLSTVGDPQATVVAFYPDSPRVFITEMSKMPKGTRMTLDLRRAGERAAAKGPDPQAVLRARIFKGVVQGALERLIVESAVSPSRARELQPSINASALFERAASGQIPLVLLSADAALPQAPPDTLARVRQEVQSGGSVALVPQRAVGIAGQERLAWWRIDRRTGETTGVTDEGLHGEYLLVHSRGRTVQVLTNRFEVLVLQFHSAAVAADSVAMYLALGARWSGLPFRNFDAIPH